MWRSPPSAPGWARLRRSRSCTGRRAGHRSAPPRNSAVAAACEHWMAAAALQKAEYEWPGANNAPRFKPEHPVTKLEGDHDVFGDGSVTILSTPGHTPGHQSLLIKLPHTGAVALSGDAIHFKSNWDDRGVPSNNFSKEQTLSSVQKISEVMEKEKAQLWINHDKAQRDTLKMSPEFYDREWLRRLV